MTNESDQPTLPEFLAAVKADDAAVAADMFANMPEPEEMFAAVQRDTPANPLAIFPVERTAWHWLFMKYGDNDNFTVRPFMVSAAAAE